ncbi:TRAP transporter large permease subunit [Mailhella sp.]|uniref:TRAP transporter large permease subunit n=1 Tax=Mailhella sp. TaxID=1981029 RepID=UPI003AB2F0E8
MSAPAHSEALSASPLDAAAQKLTTFCKWLSVGGIGCFLVIVLITFFDVFLRSLFSSPISGAHEVTEMLMPIVVFSGIAYTQCRKSHVTMDIFTETLKPDSKITLECSTTIWSAAICCVCIWATGRLASNTTTITHQLGLPINPFVWFVCFGFCTLLAAFVIDALRLLDRVRRIGKGHAAFAILFGVIPVLIAWYVATHRFPGLGAVNLGIIGLCVMLFMFICGMPVAFALMAAGFVFSCAIRGFNPAMVMFGQVMFTGSSSYNWVPLMFFMLMGYFCYYGDLGRDLYSFARNWIGHFRGGLAQGSVCACAAFGAVVGDHLSGSIAMNAIALPEMRANNYDDKLAVGTLACAGVIGSLIPPSTNLIMYGVLAEQSVSELFMAGAIPGVILTILFCITVWIIAVLHPSAAPTIAKVPMKERMRTLKYTLPILVLFVLVIGGIYGGIFTPAEGGGIGAVGAFLVALFMRRMTMKKFIAALNDSAKFIAMCFAVLTGAAMLSYFMTLSRIPTVMASSIASLELSGGLTMLAIVIVMIVLGCFVPALPLLLVCVPIFLPIASVYHWNLVWFGVLMVILLNMGTITPPFGVNLFVIKELAKVPLNTMFRAAIPFAIAMTVLVAIVYFIPQTALWLPSVFK